MSMIRNGLAALRRLSGDHCMLGQVNPKAYRGSHNPCRLYATSSAASVYNDA